MFCIERRKTFLSLLPDAHLPNPDIYFVARRLKLPLNFKSKVVIDPKCSAVIPRNAKEIASVSKPIDRGAEDKGPFSEKFALWENHKNEGHYAHIINIIFNIDFIIVFMLSILTLITHSSLKSKTQ